MKVKNIFLYEWLHFTKSQLKVVALVLFCLAAVYGLQNGYSLFKEQTLKANYISKKQEEAFQQVNNWLDKGKKGPDERPYVDITKPLWAFYYTPTWAWKQPSPMMVYSIGQAEQFGYYKKVTEWSTVSDSDLTEEIANPERLANRVLDFGFVVVYLSPLLLIILVYNINGYEKDRGMLKLINVQSTHSGKWLITRTFFYFAIVALVFFLLMLTYASLFGIFSGYTQAFLHFLTLSILYLSIWSVAFFLIILAKSSSMIQAVTMISVWLVFCLVLPASVQQAASMKYPAIYMTDFLDAKRQELFDLYDIYELSQDSLKMQLLKPDLGLQNTRTASDSLIDPTILTNTMPYLANRITRLAAEGIEARNEAKNRFIKKSYWYNPTSFFLNQLNAICDTDYYAYRDFRKHIQGMIDTRATTRAIDSWNKEVIDRERILYYMKAFGQDSNEQE